MNRWIFVLFMFVSSSAAVACGSQSAAVSGPSSTATMSGNWVGVSTDSSGSMMGSGISGATAGTTTWQLTQNGSAFSGTMRLAGSMSVMMVSGTMNGKTGSFTMTMPMGSMMSSGCSSDRNRNVRHGRHDDAAAGNVRRHEQLRRPIRPRPDDDGAPVASDPGPTEPVETPEDKSANGVDTQDHSTVTEPRPTHPAESRIQLPVDA
jgi:hypothetical protein